MNIHDFISLDIENHVHLLKDTTIFFCVYF